MQNLPVVLISFANDSDAPLEMLAQESRSLLRILRPAETSGHIRIHREESTRLKELYEDILYFDQRLAIFHYAGHADENRLMFEGGAGRAVGLAALLGKQQQLKMVFLNGCSTEGQVQSLLRAGVPAVIATTEKIEDDIACEFAEGVYMALAAQKTVKEAYALAKAFVLSDDGVFRESIGSEGERLEVDDIAIPWTLHLNEASLKQEVEWRLSDGFTLTGEEVVDLGGRLMYTPDDQVIRMVLPGLSIPADVENCSDCNISLVGDVENGRCRICDSKKLERVREPNLSVHGVQHFAVTAEDAAVRLRAHLDSFSLVPRKFTRQLREPIAIYTPNYLMNCSTIVEYSAERGTINETSDNEWVYEWSPVTGSVEIELEGHLVNGGSIPDSIAHRRAVSSQREKQDDDTPPSGDPVSGLIEEKGAWEQALGSCTGVLSGQCSVSLQQAVDDLNARHKAMMIAAIDADISADDYRELEVDVRFRELSYKQIMLPCWLFASSWKGAPWLLSVCGRTGTVRGEPPTRWKFWKRRA